MKTLVIHPKDHTTDFLSAIYSDKKDWTIINYNPSKTELKEKIKSHDRIVMLGHGTPYGLILMQENDSPRFVIDATWVYLLRDKQCVCIWCHADEFVKKYELKGFHTGMIISEFEEAMMYAVSCKVTDITESNLLFADCVKKPINHYDDKMLNEMVDTYKHDTNPIIDFNCKNMYFFNKNMDKELQTVKDICSRIKCEVFTQKFEVRAERDNKRPIDGRIFLQVTYYAKCNKDGSIKEWHGRKWYLSEHMTEDEVIKTLYTAFKAVVEHEIMEGFKVDDKILFNPHLSYLELLAISDKEVKREEH